MYNYVFRDYINYINLQICSVNHKLHPWPKNNPSLYIRHNTAGPAAPIARLTICTKNIYLWKGAQFERSRAYNTFRPRANCCWDIGGDF